MVGEFTFCEHLVNKVWQINRSYKRLIIIIVSTNFNGFSSMNHVRLTKFAKLPPPNFPAIR